MSDRGNPFSHYDDVNTVPHRQPVAQSQLQQQQQQQQSVPQPYFHQENMVNSRLDELKKMIGNVGSIVYNTKQDLDTKMDILEKKIDELNANLVTIKENVTANNNLQTAITVAVLGEGFKESKIITEECRKMRESISNITDHIKKDDDIEE